MVSLCDQFEEPLFLADIDPQQKDELVTFVTQAVNHGLTSEFMLDVSTKYGLSTWQALELAGWMSRQNKAPKKAVQLVEDWGAQAPYVLPREGGRGRLALTYMASAAIASMLGDTGANPAAAAATVAPAAAAVVGGALAAPAAAPAAGPASCPNGVVANRCREHPRRRPFSAWARS
eukprot:COSAG05_NODE_14_length_36349_cov_27.641655_20_plen_176_part_00